MGNQVQSSLRAANVISTFIRFVRPSARTSMDHLFRTLKHSGIQVQHGSTRPYIHILHTERRNKLVCPTYRSAMNLFTSPWLVDHSILAAAECQAEELRKGFQYFDPEGSGLLEAAHANKVDGLQVVRRSRRKFKPLT